jgi:transcriptional regulator with XRE-family HTH domain
MINTVNMSIVSDNIKFLRKRLGITQQEFADKIEIKRSLVGAYEEGRADPRISNLIKMSELFAISIDDLVETALWKMSEADFDAFQKEGPDRKFKVLSITVDQDDNENIELIPQKAAAGYLNGFADPEYIKEQPRFKLPFLPGNASYRAFEISGDSMLPIKSGTIVVGAYVERVQDIKNGKTYILLTQSEGVVFKRVFNYLEEKGNLYLVSDNRMYTPYELDPSDVVEIWESKAYISVDFTDPHMSTSQDVSVDELANIVMDLKKEISGLKKST